MSDYLQLTNVFDAPALDQAALEAVLNEQLVPFTRHIFSHGGMQIHIAQPGGFRLVFGFDAHGQSVMRARMAAPPR